MKTLNPNLLNFAKNIDLDSHPVRMEELVNTYTNTQLLV